MRRALLARLRGAFLADLPVELRARFDRAEAAAGDGPGRLLAGQVFLARQLADYWQRFERYQQDDAERTLAEACRPGWLRRLFGRS
jgi:hypothetical protein